MLQSVHSFHRLASVSTTKLLIPFCRLPESDCSLSDEYVKEKISTIDVIASESVVGNDVQTSA